MDNPLIKICGVRTPELAYSAGLAGANFIGIVFHPQSRRYVSLEQGRLIAVATRNAGAIPVAVFVEHTAVEMREICETTGIEVVQLHGDLSRQEHHVLGDRYQRIYVLPSSRGLSAGSSFEVRFLDPADKPRDDETAIQGNYILFDTPTPGQGIPFNWDQFSYNGPLPFGIAGGLTPQNVAIAIKKCHPALVDVSSGVENPCGEKDIILIKQFIGACNDTK